MAAARFSSEALQMFYRPINWEENLNLPHPLQPDRVPTYDTFPISQTDFKEWLRVCRVDVWAEHANNKDLLKFARETKSESLGSVKVSLGLEVKFSIEREGETQYVKHYFHDDEPHVFNRHNKDNIKEEFNRFVERSKGEIEHWLAQQSGWVVERITIVYVNVARCQPLHGRTYLPLPANLAKKKKTYETRITNA